MRVSFIIPASSALGDRSADAVADDGEPGIRLLTLLRLARIGEAPQGERKLPDLLSQGELLGLAGSELQGGRLAVHGFIAGTLLHVRPDRQDSDIRKHRL